MTKLLHGTAWGGAGLLALVSMAACGLPVQAAATNGAIRQVQIQVSGTTIRAHAITASRNLQVRYQFQVEMGGHWQIVQRFGVATTYQALPGQQVRAAALTAWQVGHHQWGQAVTSTSAGVQGVSVPFAQAEQAVTPGYLTRIGGSTAPAIAADLAQPVSLANAYQDGSPSQTVIIAPSGTSWADEYAVLAANPLASVDHAPILLSTSPTALGSSALSAITQLQATTAILVGPDNTPALRQQLTARHLYVQGLGSADPVTTGAAIARALLQATDQSSFADVFIVAPNSAAQDVTITSPADHLQAPFFVTTPPTSTNHASLPAPEAVMAKQATTTYQIGPDAYGPVVNAAQGSPPVTVAGIPTSTDIVRLGDPSAWDTAFRVDFHWFYSAWTPELVNVAPQYLAADLAAGPEAAATTAPLIPFTGTTLTTPVAMFLQTLAKGTFTPVAIGNTAVVPPVVMTDAQDVAGGTVFATLEAQNMAYYNRIATEFHTVIPLIPASGPDAFGVSTLGLENNAAIIRKYGGPVLPLSLQAIGVHPAVPSNQAIVGLTPQLQQQLILEGSRVPAVGGPLTPGEIQATVRAVVRSIINSTAVQGSHAFDHFFANPEATTYVVIRPHLLPSVQAAAQAEQKFLPYREWTYRAWVNMSHATISSHVPSVSPVNATMAGLTFSGITVHLIQAYTASGRLYMVNEEALVAPINLVLIQGASGLRWYNDNQIDGQWTPGPVAGKPVLWSEPVH